MPYIDDDINQDDFRLELLETFPDGIHGALRLFQVYTLRFFSILGTENGCGEYINDFILYYTVKNVEQDYPDIRKLAAHWMQTIAEFLAHKKLFRLIYEQFPNKLQKHDLELGYSDLRQRFEPHLVPASIEFDDNGFQRVNVTPASLLDSYERLQCQRCALYDCPHHESMFCMLLARRQSISFVLQLKTIINREKPTTTRSRRRLYHAAEVAI